MGWGANMTPTEKEIARTWVDTLGVKTTARRTSLPADHRATPRSQCLREPITSNCVKQHKVERKELIASGPGELFQFQFQNHHAEPSAKLECTRVPPIGAGCSNSNSNSKTAAVAERVYCQPWLRSVPCTLEAKPCTRPPVLAAHTPGRCSKWTLSQSCQA